MPANIAQTSFSTGPDNKAVTVDVYATPPLKPTNNQPAIANTEAAGLFGVGNNEKLSFLKTVAKRYAQTGKLLNDKDTIIKNIGAAFGVPNGNVKTITGTIGNNLLKSTGFYATGIGGVVDGISRSITGNSFDKSLSGGFSDVSLVIKNVKTDFKKLKDFDYSNLTQLSNAISQLSGDNDIIRLLNLTEAAGVIKGLNGIASEYSIPGVASMLMSKMSSDDKVVVSALLASSLTNVSDLSTIDTLLSHLSATEVLNSNPNIIKLLVSGYNGGSTYTTPAVAAANELLSRLTALSAHWNQTYVSDGVYSDNLEIYREFSSFAKDSFIMAGYNVEALAIASSYDSREFKTVLAETYPTVVV